MLNCTCTLLHIKTNVNPRGKKVQMFTLLSPEVPRWLIQPSAHTWKDTQVPGCDYWSLIRFIWVISMYIWKFKPAPGKPSLPHISLAFSWRCAQHLAHISFAKDLFLVPKFYVWISRVSRSRQCRVEDLWRQKFNSDKSGFYKFVRHLSVTVFNPMK